MVFANATGVISDIIESGSNTVTGSVIATLFFILLFLIILCLMFGIPLEFIAVILLPICISVGAYYSDFFKPLIVFLIYLAMILSKNWIFK